MKYSFRFLHATFAASLAASSVSAAIYSVTDLGARTAYGINSYGMVAGGTGDTTIPGNYQTAPFLFDGASIDILAIPQRFPGTNTSSLPVVVDFGQARVVNDAGIVAGFGLWEDLYSYQVPFVRIGTNGYVIATEAGTAVGISDDKIVVQDRPGGSVFTVDAGGWIFDLNTLAAIRCPFFPTGINLSNVVVGFSGTLNTTTTTDPLSGRESFVQTGTNVATLRLPASVATVDAQIQAGRCSAFGINSQGVIVGSFSGPKLLQDRPPFVDNGFVLTSPQDAILIDTMGWARSVAQGINDAGQVIGWVADNSGNTRAIIANANATPVNNYLPATDLNAMIPPDSGWVLTKATAINAQGSIIGEGLLNGAKHAFLLTGSNLVAQIAPQILAGPQATNVVIGSAFTLTVTATGTRPLNYQWQKDNSDVSGATNATFTIPKAQAGDSGSYRVVLTNKAGSAKSAAVNVTVETSAEVPSHFVSGLVLTGEIGKTYQIQGKNQLGDAAWTTVATITLTNTSQDWADLDSPQHLGRLYRAVSQP